MFGILKKESWPQVGIDIQLWILNDIWEIILYETANIKFPLHMASKLIFFQFCEFCAEPEFRLRGISD